MIMTSYKVTVFIVHREEVKGQFTTIWSCIHPEMHNSSNASDAANAGTNGLPRTGLEAVC